MRSKMMILTVAFVTCLSLTILFAADEKEEQVNPEVQKLIEKLNADVDKLSVTTPEGASEEDKAKHVQEFNLLKNFMKNALIPLCINKVFVEEVTKQNAKQVDIEEIKKIDKEWIEAEDELPIHVEKMGNACAQEIKKTANKLPVLTECFVMDNQGANVGQNALTSDYWQGDEAKWKNSYKSAEGGVDVGQRQLDKSTNVVDQKVSMPIINKQGKVIGAVCYGVKVEKLNEVTVASNK